jgi:hypothetical protein
MLTKALLCARRRAGLTCRSVQLTQHNSPHPTRLFRSSAFSRGNNNDDDDMYKIQVPPIPQEKLTITFSTSSGPGGQNVNKVNTRAELRFNVREADWIPEEMLERFMELHKSRIVKVQIFTTPTTLILDFLYFTIPSFCVFSHSTGTFLICTPSLEKWSSCPKDFEYSLKISRIAWIS